MSEEYSTDSEFRRLGLRRRLALGAVALSAIVVLIIGMIGGAAGFVLLSNSNAPAVTSLRNWLGINQNSSVAIPVKETLQLQESSQVIDAAKKVSPAVVSISISQTVQDFFGQTSTTQVAGGTGFILTSDGLIVTNKHVVETPGSYKVVLNDGRIFDATITATDPSNDLAFIRIKAKDLPTVEIGNSDNLQIGQFVLAVGNALGEFNNSVSLGVVSAINRHITADASTSVSEDLTGLIQTDAAINPGNSGGPLVNLAGQVVGINTAIASPSGGSIGIGFSIPINSVRNAINSVRKTGTIIRPYLGLRYISIDKSVQQLDNLSVDYGALITAGQNPGEVAVLPGSPADKAGVQANDIILELNGERINSDTTLTDLLQKYNPGDQVTLTIQRQGKNISLKATLGQAPTSAS